MNNCYTILGIVIFSCLGRAQDLRNTVHDMGLLMYGHGTSEMIQLNQTETVRWNWALFSTGILSDSWYVHAARISRRSYANNFSLKLEWSGWGEWSTAAVQFDTRIRLSQHLGIAAYQRTHIISGEGSISSYHRWGTGFIHKSEDWKSCLWALDWMGYDPASKWESEALALSFEALYHYPENWWSGVRMEGSALSEFRLGVMGELDYSNWGGRLSVYTDGSFTLIGTFPLQYLSCTIGLNLGWSKPSQPHLAIGNHVED